MATDPIESPEAFAERCLPCQCHDGFRSRNLRDPSCPRHNFADDVADAIRARDAAVRREARELLFTWEQLAREGAFGEDFAACAPDCDCVVCATHAALATGGSNV